MKEWLHKFIRYVAMPLDTLEADLLTNRAFAQDFFQTILTAIQHDYDVNAYISFSKKLTKLHPQNRGLKRFFCLLCILYVPEQTDFFDAFIAWQSLQELAAENDPDALLCLAEVLSEGNFYVHANPEQSLYFRYRLAQIQNDAKRLTALEALREAGVFHVPPPTETPHPVAMHYDNGDGDGDDIEFATVIPLPPSPPPLVPSWETFYPPKLQSQFTRLFQSVDPSDKKISPE